MAQKKTKDELLAQLAILRTSERTLFKIFEVLNSIYDSDDEVVGSARATWEGIADRLLTLSRDLHQTGVVGATLA